MIRYLKILPYLILLGGFALRLYRLGANSLWYDETVSVFLAQSDLAELIRHTAGDIHPPFYYLLLHFWGRLAGWSEFSAAFLSLWFGVLLIALVFRITRQWLHNNVIALVAALFVAISPYNIWYSQEVRMYTLGAALGLLSVYFLRNMFAQSKIFTRDFSAYVIFTVLGFYTLYYFVFLVVFQWAWVAYRIGQSRRTTNDERRTTNLLSTFLLSQFALILLYLPWLPIAFRQATDPPVPPWREFIALPQVALESLSVLAFGQAVDLILGSPLALLLFIPIGALLFTRNPAFQFRGAVSPWFLLGYTFLPLAAIYLFSLWKPLYHVRYIFTYSPAFYILAAYALYATGKALFHWRNARRDALPRVVIGLGAFASLVFLIVMGYSLYNFWHNPHYAEDDLRGAMNYIAERWRPGDVILVNAGYTYPAFAYYFPDPIARRVRLPFYTPLTGGATALATASKRPILLMTGSIDGAKNLGWKDARSDFYATTAEETREALDRVFDAHPRVWVLWLYDTVVDPNGVTRQYLSDHARLFEEQGFTGESQLRVQGFIPKAEPLLPVTAELALIPLGGRVQLFAYETGARTLRVGDAFDVVLYWRLLQTVNHNYQMSLQLLDHSGQNVAQFDEAPLSEVMPMTRWKVGELYREPVRLKIPKNLAPGEYRAIVKLYEPRSGEVLGEVIELGNIHVR